MKLNINDLICLLQRYSQKYDSSEKRKLLNNKEYFKEEYSIGVIINQVNVISYEVYCYAIGNENQKVVSSLLMKRFKEYEIALEYFNYLNIYIKNHSILEILKKCKNNKN